MTPSQWHYLGMSRGNDVVGIDHVDGDTQDSGFSLTTSNPTSHNTVLATEAHTSGLAIRLENDHDQITSLVNERCFTKDDALSSNRSSTTTTRSSASSTAAVPPPAASAPAPTR